MLPGGAVGMPYFVNFFAGGGVQALHLADRGGTDSARSQPRPFATGRGVWHPTTAGTFSFTAAVTHSVGTQVTQQDTSTIS